jgi:hypothetical protein
MSSQHHHDAATATAINKAVEIARSRNKLSFKLFGDICLDGEPR